MARTWLITGRGIVRKVKNANCFDNDQIKDLGVGANRECPNCKHLIDNSDVTSVWPGLPAGVRFDPSDVELLEHLAGKIGLENSKLHMLIDEFIPMLDEDEGICYTHPENLPGAKKDGSSIHFFHRISNAYGTGQHKRRKINQHACSEECVRWHKTGKTKRVLENGWKKIMVLYRSSKRGSKPARANWVMHQYHLGTEEDEKEGELVVSKIFYQHSTNHLEKTETDLVNEESNVFTVKIGPRTPNTNTPQPPRQKRALCIRSMDIEEHCPTSGAPLLPLSISQWTGEVETPACWAGESQAVDEPDPINSQESLLCHEVLDFFPNFEDSSLHVNGTNLNWGRNVPASVIDGLAIWLTGKLNGLAGPILDSIASVSPSDV
ncbi:No apical meristem (NAM) protein [Musa troglodytarum]|uniref:No apical meristem (NAM) protein n=1 Tax=Musa troglodytarum TaxID=320322 RepID=A0A9E7L843_9LILI|nr:No apical meristem (NAM) protein [Musa troglodytarum]